VKNSIYIFNGKIVACSNCNKFPDDTIKFIALGPHNNAYDIK